LTCWWFGINGVVHGNGKYFMEENEDVIVKFGLLELEETMSNSL
jgi:hypothetical protein